MFPDVFYQRYIRTKEHLWKSNLGSDLSGVLGFCMEWAFPNLRNVVTWTTIFRSERCGACLGKLDGSALTAAFKTGAKSQQRFTQIPCQQPLHWYNHRGLYAYTYIHIWREWIEATRLRKCRYHVLRPIQPIWRSNFFKAGRRRWGGSSYRFDKTKITSLIIKVSVVHI